MLLVLLIILLFFKPLASQTAHCSLRSKYHVLSAQVVFRRGFTLKHVGEGGTQVGKIEMGGGGFIFASVNLQGC